MATRGKEVQDFIKENKKSARERFEELGFKLEESDKVSISYSNEYDDIDFWLKEKKYYCDFYVSMKLLKAIEKQCEELGWL